MFESDPKRGGDPRPPRPRTPEPVKPQPIAPVPAPAEPERDYDEVVDESFPASDPPPGSSHIGPPGRE